MMWPGDVRNALSTTLIIRQGPSVNNSSLNTSYCNAHPSSQVWLLIMMCWLSHRIWNFWNMSLPISVHLPSKHRNNFRWSEQACGWLVLWKMFGVISLRPLKMRPPLLLLLEGGSSFWRCVKHHTGLSLTSRDCITSTLRHLWETIYIRYRKEVEMK